MRWLVMIGVFFLVFGCEKPPNPLVSEKESACNVVLHRVARKIKKETDLRACGSGGGITPKVRMLSLSFNSYRDLSQEEGRELLLYATKVFLDEINSNRDIKPYLLNDPFELKNIEVVIYMRDRKEATHPNEFCWIEAREGFFRYDQKDLVTGKIREVYRETYQEALERVEAKNKSIAAL